LLTINEKWLTSKVNKHVPLKRALKYYRVSIDGGKTYAVDEQVIQKGDYTPDHPFEGVWTGKNAFKIGTIIMCPISTQDGRILVPLHTTPLDADGKLYNPGPGSYYLDSVVLIGTWTDGLKIEWDVSQRVVGDPARSTQGCYEPTLAEMPDGRIFMVMRGSNNKKPHLPSYKWYSVSEDGGYHWSELKPWTYADGSNFFSPSSCSQLLRHSSGRYYWIGNICPSNAYANTPRYPLVIGEVDPQSMLLIKETVTVIDTDWLDKAETQMPTVLPPVVNANGAPNESGVQLSNFMVYEDRENRDIVLHMNRLPGGGGSGSYIYRIEPWHE
jgi:hypothetical protein